VVEDNLTLTLSLERRGNQM